MNTSTAIKVFESLSSAIRLDIYRRLVKAGPSGMVAGEIGAALDIPPTNLSFHLKSLVHAGLATAEQEGRYQRYRPNLATMRDIVAFLTEECCSGAPENCSEVGETMAALERSQGRRAQGPHGAGTGQ
jgi:DNA-binding transcriptional ArsR family regulator